MGPVRHDIYECLGQPSVAVQDQGSRGDCAATVLGRNGGAGEGGTGRTDSGPETSAPVSDEQSALQAKDREYLNGNAVWNAA